MIIAVKYIGVISVILGLASLVFIESVMAGPRAVAFFYGASAPVEQLARFDWVVVQAGHFNGLKAFREQGVEAFAYISVGEVEEQHLADPSLKPEWLIGRNAGWNSRVVDLTQPGLQQHILEKRMAPLWKQGYRAFFLDTLDSYQLAVKDDAGRQAQVKGLVGLIRKMHKRFPGIKLLFNRGFEVLPETASLCAGVAAESLFAGWDPVKSDYRPVPENDRTWLLGKLQDIKARYHLPVVVIDYLPAERAGEAQAVARKIRDLGFLPWVSNPALDRMGIGAILRGEESAVRVESSSASSGRVDWVGLSSPTQPVDSGMLGCDGAAAQPARAPGARTVSGSQPVHSVCSPG